MDSRKLVPLFAVGALIAVAALWAFLGADRPSGEPSLEREAVGAVAPARTSEAARESLLIASPPEPAEVEREVAGAASTVEGRPGVPKDAHWIEGRVRLPAGTPIEAELWVVARGKRFGASGSTREHRGRVDRDGDFRVACAEKTRKVSLDIESRWLFLAEPVSLRTKILPDELVLEPELGGVITGTISLPTAAYSADPFEDVGIHASDQRPGPTRRLTWREQPDARGDFEFAALPPGSHYGLYTDGGRYSPVGERGVEVLPGQETHVELELVLDVGLKGRVVDEKGVGVPDVSLATRIQHGGFSSRTQTNRKTTDEEGEFILRGSGGGKITLIASKAGHLDAVLELGLVNVGDPRDGLELVLLKGRAIEGSVHWPDGRPAEGATVKVEQASHKAGGSRSVGSGSRIAADAEGHFRISGLEEGTCTVTAKARAPETEGAGRVRAPDWIAVEGEVPAGSSGIALVLGTGLGVVGRVVDDAGVPLDDFRVFATQRANSSSFSRSGDESLTERYREANGQFELRGLVPGGWQLHATATNHVNSKPLHVDTPHAGGDVVLILARTASIKGRVIGPDGAPVARAKVRAQVALGRQVRTNSEGEYRLRRVPPGKLRLSAGHPEFGDSEAVELELEPGETLDAMTLVLRRPASLTVVVHPAATPVAGRQVKVQWAEGDYTESIVTDLAGRGELTGLSPGKYTVELRPPKKAGPSDEDSWMLRIARRHGKEVQLTSGAHTEIVLGEPAQDAIRIEGRVTEGVEPVARTVVSLSPGGGFSQNVSAARTDEAGRFSLEVAQSGEFTASVGSDFGDQVTFAVSIPDVREHSLELALPTGSMHGLVIGPDARPAVNCPIAVVAKEADPDQPSSLSQRRTQTDEAGRFEIKRLAAGTYVLTAGGVQSWNMSRRVKTFGSRQVEGLIVPEGALLDGIEIGLDAPAELSGTITGTDGQPLAGASVSITWPSGKPVSINSWWRSDAAGHFDITGLPSGPVHVRARHAGLTGDVREVELTEGGKTTIELVVDRR